MEFTFASDKTNNSYFDRILQTQVENDLHELTYCLRQCKIAEQSHKIGLSLTERLCLCKVSDM
jgi:hypothetical protein